MLLQVPRIEVNSQDLLKRTALYEAASNGNLKSVQLLLGARKSKLTATSRTATTTVTATVDLAEERGLTPLHAAALNDYEIVQLLVDHGAQVNALSEQGVSPLHNATYVGDLESTT